jgi:hypothetical protein
MEVPARCSRVIRGMFGAGGHGAACRPVSGSGGAPKAKNRLGLVRWHPAPGATLLQHHCDDRPLCALLCAAMHRHIRGLGACLSWSQTQKGLTSVRPPDLKWACGIETCRPSRSLVGSAGLMSWGWIGLVAGGVQPSPTANDLVRLALCCVATRLMYEKGRRQRHCPGLSKVVIQ